jgi:hypothetical protein
MREFEGCARFPKKNLRKKNLRKTDPDAVPQPKARPVTLSAAVRAR